MTRIGMNPLRFQPAPYQYKDIVCLVVTHLPCEEQPGYHKDRMEIVQACLNSMRNGIHRDCTFMVWDNDSKSEFRDWLQHIFEPDMLILSKNVGKNTARASAIQMLPLGSIVCYSDDDMLFEDNWFHPQMDLLLNFPNVACVSGYPIRTMFRWGNIHTLEWARKNGKLEQGRFISSDDEKDYCRSVNKNYEQHIKDTLKDIDYRVTYNNKQAYCEAHHAQFIGYTIKVLPAMQFDGMATSDEKSFDIELDKMGLRLTTTQRYVYHMGNVLDDDIREKINHRDTVNVQ